MNCQVKNIRELVIKVHSSAWNYYTVEAKMYQLSEIKHISIKMWKTTPGLPVTVQEFQEASLLYNTGD